MARQLAAHCGLVGREGALVRLALDPRQQHLRTAGALDKLAASLGRYYGTTLRVEIELREPPTDTPARLDERQASAELAAARDSLEADPTVRALQERFGATLQPTSVRPRRA